jgi:hypothetical protein
MAVTRVVCLVNGKRKGYLFYEWSENGRISDQLYASDPLSTSQVFVATHGTCYAPCSASISIPGGRLKMAFSRVGGLVLSHLDNLLSQPRRVRKG